MNKRGMTLLELLVATTIFIFLGGSLVLFLRVGVETWRVGEMRREAYERAQAILDTVAEDLRSTYSQPSQAETGVVDVLFLADFDPNMRQRLRLVRTLAGEMRHPITREAGSYTGAYADVDYVGDSWELAQKVLRAPGGLQEVAYLMDPDPKVEILWRGVRSPIAGPGSLFDDANIYEESKEGVPPHLQPVMRPLADGVLYFQLDFWGPGTRHWRTPGAHALPQSALDWWDSTRGILDPPGGTQEGVGYVAGSRNDPRDDVFPRRVQAILVLRPARATRLAQLSSDLKSDATQIPVDTTEHYPDDSFRYIRIDNEWIHYESKTAKMFLNVERGVRGTKAAAHSARTPVVYGTTFCRVIRLPAAYAPLEGQP